MQLAPAHQIPEEHPPPLSWSHLDGSWAVRKQDSLFPLPRENFELESLSSSILLEVTPSSLATLETTRQLNVVGVELGLPKGTWEARLGLELLRSRNV